MKNVTYYNAGAGSGKTHRLTKELTGLIKDKKVRPEEVILTTFTKKAAGEFKERAKALLYKEGLFDEAVRLDQALIGTVHSVCEQFIGKYWYYLGLSPKMNVMPEEDTDFYLSQSLATLPTEAELRTLHAFAWEFDVLYPFGSGRTGVNYDFWVGQLKTIIGFATNYELTDFSDSQKKSLEYIEQFVVKGCRLSGMVTDAQLVAALNEARNSIMNNNRIKKKDDYLKSFDEVEKDKGRRTLSWYKKVQKILKDTYGKNCADILTNLSNLWRSEDVYERQKEYVELMFDLAKRWQEQYAQYKREKNVLDFNDLEKYMRQLMDREDVRADIGQSFKYLFVDEFQDSSPIQVKIFDALSDLMEGTYWVGDFKQAIYGFRGSDIALTKAVVDQVKSKKDCHVEPLKKSWRSLPDIVEVCNKTFVKAFEGTLDKADVELTEVERERIEGLNSLRFFNITEEVGVPQLVAKLLHEGAKPEEIAVLTRTNAPLGQIATDLRSLGIATAMEARPMMEAKSGQLVQSMLRIVDSKDDLLAKAEVVMITDESIGLKEIIEGKLQKGETCWNGNPMVKQLLEQRQALRQQSVSAMVESMIIEMNLFDKAQRLDEDPGYGVSALQSMVTSAKDYEERCVRMSVPATIAGLIAYWNDMKPAVYGDPKGVQLLTMHSAKGLEWKYVVLYELNRDVRDENQIMKREVYGVHFDHSKVPTKENPFPEVYIRVTPWIYGTARNVPQPMFGLVHDTPEFAKAVERIVSEETRLMYVAMTRPSDVMIMALEAKKTFLKWFKDIGITNAGMKEPEVDGWDLLDCGCKFVDYSLKADEWPGIEASLKKEENRRMLKTDSVVAGRRAPRYILPSGVKKTTEMKDVHNFETRIPLVGSGFEMNVVGDCIHRIFASMEEPCSDRDAAMKIMVESYGLGDVLTDFSAIKMAWQQLKEYLTENYGAAVKTYHERPFRMEKEGQTISGSIDLVWQMEEGDLLIDFKTCPMGYKVVTEPKSDHYVGHYGGQLDTYAQALEAAGEKVLYRFIYYPVGGLLIEI